ncbi:nuclear RNA export factor 1 [Phlebotomus argentipes]|uniref:nuclear RNA export factor 1 n=1 Tax=Phlebotomus argentipes TaxID=94469 RepID=UPI002892FEA6|nr:nuclear RNA export factor 1 [Phlebotomus argentipes]
MSNMQKFRGGRGNRRFHQNNGGERFQKYRDYDEHDDRGEFPNNFQRNPNKGRRVSFKPTGRQGNRHKFSEETIRSILEEDDDMTPGSAGGSSHFQRNQTRGSLQARRRGSPVPRRGGFSGPGKRRSKLVAGTSGWYQVVIPHGHQYPKETLFKQILSNIHPDIFVPHYFATEGNGCSFFVDEFDTANRLYNSNIIQMPTGQTLHMKVYSSVPNVNVDSNLKERIKQAMAKRYNAQSRMLDLTKFHADSDLQDIFVGLSRVSIMGAAIEVIAANVPEIETLILSDNKIFSLTHFDTLAKKCLNLKNLCLRNNKIAMLNTLDNLKSLSLTELVLTGNPLKEKMQPRQYISEIRKRASKLLILDGETLPPQIGFDVSTEVTLPPAKASFLCDMSGSEIVRQFLQQYFVLYDSENRQPLLDAYHEHASFTLTTYSPFDEIPDRGIKPYSFNNRNLLNQKINYDRKKRSVKYGRLPVVSYLSELPPTQHDPDSFGVDLSLYMPQMILLTITGIFKEKRKNQSQPLRSFQKCLLIVPAGSGYCIRNEMLHITDVTKDQTMGAFKPAPVSEMTPMQPSQAPIVPVTPIQAAMPSTSGHVDDVTKMQMVQAIAQKTTMNLEWSSKCLEETNWEFDRAIHVFTELRKDNKIPPEAFVKAGSSF